MQEAYRLDQQNGNTLWREAVQKEMNNVMPAFHLLEDDENLPVGYNE